MIRAAIVGFGNIGASVLEALRTSPDFIVAGIVDPIQVSLKTQTDIPFAAGIKELENVQVAILCTPSRMVPLFAEVMAPKGIT